MSKTFITVRCIGFPLRTPCGNEAIHPKSRVAAKNEALWCDEHEQARQEHISKNLEDMVRSFTEEEAVERG